MAIRLTEFLETEFGQLMQGNNMANKKTAGAAVKAPKDPVATTHAAPSVKEELREHWNHTLVTLFGILCSFIWFLGIGAAALGIGFCVHWVHEHCPWMSPEMLMFGHGLEWLLLLADSAGLVSAVYIHLKKLFSDLRK